MSKKRKLSFKDFEIHFEKEPEEKKRCSLEELGNTDKSANCNYLPTDNTSNCESTTKIPTGGLDSIFNKNDIANDFNINDFSFLSLEADYDSLFKGNDSIELASDALDFDSAVNFNKDELFSNSVQDLSFESNPSFVIDDKKSVSSCSGTDVISATENLENIVPNFSYTSDNIPINSVNAEYETVHFHHEHEKTEHVQEIAKNVRKDLSVNETNNALGSLTIVNHEIEPNLNQQNIPADESTSVDANIEKNVALYPLNSNFLAHPQVLSDNNTITSPETKNINKMLAMKQIVDIKHYTIFKKKQFTPNILKIVGNKQSVNKVPLVRLYNLNDQNKRVKTNKAVQTANTLCKNCFTGNVDEELRKIVVEGEDCRQSVKEEIVVDKIKKPEEFNNVILFSFSLNIRNSLYCLSGEEFVNNDEKVNYYTGIPHYSYFVALLNCLNLPKNNVIAPFQMLLLTLMKLRLNLDWEDLGYRFGRSTEIAKDTFGITITILLKCLSQIVAWPIQGLTLKNYPPRKSMRFYVYSIKVNSSKCGNEPKNILICLSSINQPVHFVSKPVTGAYNRVDLLKVSSIADGLLQNDTVIFDKNVQYVAAHLSSSMNTVLSKSSDSFYTEPFNSRMQNDVNNVMKTISKFKRYKYLFDNSECEWLNQNSNGSNLFYDVVKVVSGLVNLCNVLPFDRNTVRSMIEKRSNINIYVS